LCKSLIFSNFVVLIKKNTAMSQCKNTNLFSEIETFFKKSGDNAIQAMTTALKAIKLTGRIPALDARHNATVSMNAYSLYSRTSLRNSPNT